MLNLCLSNCARDSLQQPNRLPVNSSMNIRRASISSGSYTSGRPATTTQPTVATPKTTSKVNHNKQRKGGKEIALQKDSLGTSEVEKGQLLEANQTAEPIGSTCEVSSKRIQDRNNNNKKQNRSESWDATYTPCDADSTVHVVNVEPRHSVPTIITDLNT